ncbi:hypothetical protein TRIP_B40168 [uncultured Desulfatiglans sp.]|nr:hypothetical protein TRIP_B40168 [uncultured Desulfatiglans sp.]
MVFLANPGVNLHVCLCDNHQVASTQELDFIDFGHMRTRSTGAGRNTRSV